MQVRSIIFVCLLSITSFFPAFANEQKVIKYLKEGGKLILIRHSEAPGTGDPAHFNLNDCKTQRNLSAEGIEQAKRLGEFFKKIISLLKKFTLPNIVDAKIQQETHLKILKLFQD